MIRSCFHVDQSEMIFYSSLKIQRIPRNNTLRLSFLSRNLEQFWAEIDLIKVDFRLTTRKCDVIHLLLRIKRSQMNDQQEEDLSNLKEISIGRRAADHFCEMKKKWIDRIQSSLVPTRSIISFQQQSKCSWEISLDLLLWICIKI